MLLCISCTSSSDKNSLPPSQNEQSNIESPLKQSPETSLSYENMECGYKLTFPESWLGYYIINDQRPNDMSIYFYGKSIAGTVIYEKIGCYGLPMFAIVNEDILNSGAFDSSIKIGTACGINYYYVRFTGTDLNLLMNVASGVYPDFDETEKQLAGEEWEKVEEMFNEIDILLESFDPVD